MTEITESWYSQLIEELNSIVDGVVESRFNYSWELIECYHQIGARLLQENSNFERSQIYGEKITQRVAKSIGRSKRTLDYAVQFARLFPDLNLLPEGKNIHWRHVINKYLTTGEKKSTIKKIDLLRMIKEIKELLSTEYLKAHQEEVTLTPASFGYNSNRVKIEFIRYLQDQFNKITGGIHGQ